MWPYSKKIPRHFQIEFSAGIAKNLVSLKVFQFSVSPRLRTSSQSLTIGGYPVLEIALMTGIVAANAAYYTAQTFMYAGEVR